jgi:tetratricopeptide (TPR) repeat protein
VKEKLPLFALSAASCVATALVPGLLITNAQRLPLLQRLGNALVSYVVYLGQMLFPAGLAAPYPNPPNGQPLWKVCLAFVLLAAITGGVLLWRKKRPCLLAGWLWYLGMLLPVIGIIQISPDAAHADRYTYLPGIGLALAGTWAAADWSAGWKLGRMALGGLMIGAMGALMVCAHIQTSYWKDDASLWRRALACTSGNYVADYNLAHGLANHGQLGDAIALYRQALQIRPDLPQPRYNLANALFKQGNLDEAIAEYRRTLEIEPEHLEARYNLGAVLATKGQFEAAIAQYQKVLAIQSGYRDVHYNLGQIFLKQGKLDEAVVQFNKALEIKPDDAEFRNGLGKALLLKSDFAGAMACFDKTTPLSPDPLARWDNLGDNFLEKEDWAAAIACYQHALKINPRSADACASLGMAFFKKGAAREAIDSWQQALAINPGQISVLNNLAWLLATAADTSLRDGAKAVALATQASQLSGGGNPVMLHTLAVAYAQEGSYTLAMDTARRALQLAVEQKKDALAATLQKEIKLYQTNTPPRNPPQ